MHVELVNQAKELLSQLGMDSIRCNDRSALTFLSLVRLKPGMAWRQATGEMYTTRQIMDWIRDGFGVDYAANSRESIRKESLRQFVAGGIVEHNADDPSRPTNSQYNNYRISAALLPLVRLYGTPDFERDLPRFLAGINTFKLQQNWLRDMNKTPVTLPDGRVVRLVGTGQNDLLKEMIESFCPRFVPGGTVLYIDDTEKSEGALSDQLLDRLGVGIPPHGKAPDLMVWDSNQNWLFLMEACSTHGPIDAIRKADLESLFRRAEPAIVFVSCFPDRATMRRYLCDLAWETEAWCADAPDHMIHLDGTHFLGPAQ